MKVFIKNRSTDDHIGAFLTLDDVSTSSLGLCPDGDFELEIITNTGLKLCYHYFIHEFNLNGTQISLLTLFGLTSLNKEVLNKVSTKKAIKLANKIVSTYRIDTKFYNEKSDYYKHSYINSDGQRVGL